MVALLLGLSVIVLPAPASAAVGCAPNMVYFVPGTTETNPQAGTAPRGMLKPVADKLKSMYGSQVGVPFVPYPAVAFSEGKTYQESKQTGEKNLLALMAQCPDSRKVPAGYSQGAAVAGDALAQLGNSADAQRVLGGVLLADPNKGGLGEINIGELVPGTGIGGPRAGYGLLNGKVMTICKNGDKWCSKGEGDNPISTALGKLLAGAPLTPAAGAAVTQAAAPVTNAVGVAKPAVNTPKDLSQLATALQPMDFTRASVPQLPANVAGLEELLSSVTGSLKATGGTVSTPEQAAALSAAQSRARSVADTLTPVAGALSFIDSDKTVKARVEQAAAGTSLVDVRAVRELLPTPKAQTAATKVTDIVRTLDRAQSSTAGAGESVQAAWAASKDLSTTVRPLSEQSVETLSAAGSRLATVQPEAATDQLGGALKLVSALNSKDITTSVQTIGQNLLTGRVPTAQADATKLFTALEPVAKMGDTVSWNKVGQTVAAVPDESGTTSLLGTLLSSLQGVDFQRLYTLAMTIKDAVFQLATTGNVMALATAVPAALELATIGARVLFGGAAAIIPALGRALTSPGAGNLFDVAKEGIEFGQFFGSGAAPHVQYGAPLANTGNKTGLDTMTSAISRLIGG